jgi:hypothetical protein
MPHLTRRVSPWRGGCLTYGRSRTRDGGCADRLRVIEPLTGESDGFAVVRQQILPLPPADAFELFSDAHNLEAVTPPWLCFRVVTPAPIRMRAGTLIEYRLRLHGLPMRWLTRIEVWEPGRRFEDRQLRGPYRFWHHAHIFEAHEAAR